MNYRELAVFRPIRLTDIDDLFSLSNKTGIGLTSLPKQKELLLEKIKKSIESFKGNISLKKDCLFLFVLENLSNNKVIGCSGIISVGTDDEPAYYLHVDFNNFLLTLTSHYHGTSELCSLFLDPDYRINNNGKLLSRARLIFLSENKVFKNKQIIAEMRGLFVKENESPFWDYFFKDKLNLTVAEAISLRRTGNKQKIIDLIGKKSISFKNIPDEIKNNIGAVHDETKAAVFLLKQEGFIFNSLKLNADSKFQQMPDADTERQILYITGASGSGKLKMKLII